MPFVVQTLSDIGSRNPAVARLCVQSPMLIEWIDLKPRQQEALNELFIVVLRRRILKCQSIHDQLVQALLIADRKINAQRPPHFAVPFIPELDGFAESFLYEAKDYLRDLLRLFGIVYGCKLKDASDLADPKDKGVSKAEQWAHEHFGPDHLLTMHLAVVKRWVLEIVRKRNAVQHPEGHSGTLKVENIHRHPEDSARYVPPTWARAGTGIHQDQTDVITDMRETINNLLELAEDLLTLVLMDKKRWPQLVVYEIPVAQRDPMCPMRLRLGVPSLEVQQDKP